MTVERKRWPDVIIAAAFALPVFFFGPVQIFLNNPSEFSVSLSQLFWRLGALGLGATAVLAAATRRWSGVLAPALSFLGVAAFLESQVFLGLARHRPFDGQRINWAQLNEVAIVELATMAFLATLVVTFRRRRDLWQSAGLFILLFHALNLGYAATVSPGAVQPGGSRSSVFYFRAFSHLSAERNVVHLVPDQTQNAQVYDIIQSNRAHYSQVFDGFTLFTNATGEYPSTYPSVPLYMTGLSVDPLQDHSASQPLRWNDVRRDLEERSIVSTLADNGFRTFGYQFGTLYCVKTYSGCTTGDVFDGLPLEDDGLMTDLLELQDLAFFQVAPLAVRRHVYNDGDWLLKRLHGPGHTFSGILDSFLARMETGGTPTYNYFHLVGGHAPLQFDERCEHVGIQEITYENQRRQVTCTLLQVERLIARLKSLGVYDQTAIVINSDHGTPSLSPSRASKLGHTISPAMVGNASVLMLIKPMKARGPLRLSNAQVAIGDIPATVADLVDLEATFPGESVFRVEEGSTREREFFVFDDQAQVARLQALPNLRRYRIRGDVFDEASWVRPGQSDGEVAPTGLWMDHANVERYASGFGALDVQVVPRRAIMGTQARVSLSFPTSRRTNLVIDSFVPPSIQGQSLEISINGTVIASLDSKQLAARTRHVVLVPGRVERRTTNVIELEMHRAGEGHDDRMWIAYLGLEASR